MRPASRTILTSILTTLLVAGALAAQETPQTASPPAEAVASAEPADQPAPTTVEASEPDPALASTGEEPETAYELRRRFAELMRRQPPELGNVLALDPSLLENREFLATHPDLARFLAANPRVRSNPRFYLEDFAAPRQGDSFVGDFLEGLTILGVFALIAFALAWLVRTIIEQKRWNRLSSTQSEVHSRILERFGTSEELLAYMKTPAGSRFLESAPIPLRQDRPVQSGPFPRALWSVQIGVVVAVGALGMLLVSGRLAEEAARELFSLGVIAFFVGAGFILSAAASIFLSRRLGLWEPPPGSGYGPASVDPADEPGFVE